MKKNTRSNAKRTGSFESSGSNATSVRAATITIVVLHLAFILGVFSQGCKKDNFAENSNTPDNGEENATGPASNYPEIPQVNGSGGPNAILRNGSNPDPSEVETNTTDLVNSNVLVDTPRLSDISTNSPSENVSGDTNSVETIDPNAVNSGSNTNKPGNTPILTEDIATPHSDFTGSEGSQNGENENVETSETQNTASDFIEVTIQKNDNLGKIAKRHNTTVKAIMELNADKISDPGKIQIGWVIKVPGTESGENEDTETSDDTGSNNGSASSEFETYVVQKKDTLSSIGRKFDVSYKEIQKLNNITTDKIFPGDELLIPKKEE